MFSFSFLWRGYDSYVTFLKYVRLSAIFFCIIGVYAIMMPTKDVVFLKTVGSDYLSIVKTLSVLCIIPLVILYSIAANYVSRHKLLYWVSFSYALIAALCGISLSRSVCILDEALLSPTNLIGWVWYIAVDSFGALTVSLFWGFVADISHPQDAKRGFSLIAFGAQVGGVLIPLLFYKKALLCGPLPFFPIITLGISAIGVFLYCFMWVTPVSQLKGFSHTRDQVSHTSFLEGLSLLYRESYLRAIFFIVMSYEVVLIFFEVKLKLLANDYHSDINSLHAFFFRYSICSNGIALCAFLLGISNVRRYAPLVFVLSIVPCVAMVLLGANLYIPCLSVFFWGIVFMRGMNYSINQPAKEELYVPTSPDVKYKAKGWIDIFGARLGKSTGSALHLLKPVLHSVFEVVGAFVIGFFISVWLYSIAKATSRYTQAVRDNKGVGCK